MERARAYREWTLAGPLASTFRVVWTSGATGARAVEPDRFDGLLDFAGEPLELMAMPDVQLVLPDGQADLIWLNGAWYVAGPDLVAQAVTERSAAAVVGFRFQPGVAAGWLRQPLEALVNQRILLADVAPVQARRLAASPLAEPGTVPEVLAAMQSLAATEMTPVEPRLLAAYAMLNPWQPADRERTRLADLTAQLGMSERTLRRRFAATFGYGPRTMSRVLRFQRFLDLAIAAPLLPLSQLAFATGYADQAHLSRECQALAGQTPASLVRSRRGPMPPAALDAPRNERP